MPLFGIALPLPYMGLWKIVWLSNSPVPENIGWIDTIEVYPADQSKGIAQTLIKERLNNMKKVGIDTVYPGKLAGLWYCSGL